MTTDIGVQHDNLFNGTLWDDNVNDPATDHVYTNLVTATALSPEGRLSAFRGENPNGVWTLKVQDDAATNTGNMASWSLDISALASAPTESTATFSRTPGVALADNAITLDLMPVAGAGSYLDELALYLEIPHTFPDDLEIRLTSPAGTTVTVVTDNGGSFDNVFNGTTFDVDAPTPVSDQLYANLVVVPLVSPEGSFDNFLGQNPNGTWTLSVTDDAATNLGSLVRWDLALTTTSNPGAPAATAFAGTTGAIPDSGAPAPTYFTATASGLSGVLWDVDLHTTISHAFNADLDVTLTAPSGASVTITTDNAFTANVFNGTLFDDNVNDPVTDHAYTANVTATPLSPEGRLSSLRGENPNGVWTLVIADDTVGVNGSLAAWSLDLATVPALPSTTTTTFTSSPNAVVLDLATVTDVIAVSGLGASIAQVTLYTEILHSWADDVDILLTSPAGTIVAVATDCAGNLDDVFNGTVWNPDSSNAPSDYVDTNLVAAPLLAPEGSFDNFLGQNPNGNWTLSVADDHGLDTGLFVRWDLSIATCGGSLPTSYCTPNAGGTSNGCVPTIAGTANPNVSHSNFCVITVSNVEGLQSGLIFYGSNGALNLPWCTGGNSYFCVRQPTERTPVQNSGGASGQCNGALSVNWNAFQVAHPTALGNPWLAGAKANVQGWFRDPTACKTTFLSQALELTYQP
jgi:subtilisin-like proprotein convertase family protein